MKKEMRAYIKRCLLAAAPKLAFDRERHLYYKDYVINDLAVYSVSKIKYDPLGAYPTIRLLPPENYLEVLKSKHLDESGVPRIEAKGELIYHPVHAIQYGLAEYGYYVTTKDAAHLQRARCVVKWLLDNQCEKTGCWYYTTDNYHEQVGYLLKAPWASAMAQGQAASLLCRLYYIDHDKRLLDVAENAFNLFDVPVTEGGLCADLFSHKVYEEYPTIPASFTLNGFIFSSFGLYDLCQYTNNDRIHQLWEQAQETLRFMIPLYDDDLCSSYCLSHITARKTAKNQNLKYHMIHVMLLQNLESIFPDPTFEYYIKKWAKMCGIKIR